jgi:DNA-binding MarR family transcriptional regulator
MHPGYGEIVKICTRFANTCYNDYSGAVPPHLQPEIKQPQLLPSLEEEAFLALVRTADHLQRRLSQMLKPHRLSPTQYNALRILRGAGSHGLACREIGNRMINRDPDITRLLDRLEHRSLIRRGRERNDRRVIRACITARGLDLLRGLDAEIAQFHRKLLGPLGEPQLESMIRLLEAARGLP